MGVFRVAAIAAMTSLACIPSMAQAGACWYPNEARAAQVRGLQTMLMVGTLQCRRSHWASEDLYNDFVRRQRGFLDSNAQVLKARFMRESGIERGQGAYDRFGTQLANQYSAQLDDSEFCATVHHFARLAARATNHELLMLAEAVAEAPASGVCRPSDYSFDRPAMDDSEPDYRRRDEPPPPPRIAIAEAADTAPVPAPVKAVAPAAAAEPVALVTAQTEYAPPPPVPAEAKVALIEKVAEPPQAEPAIVQQAAVVEKAAAEVAAAPEAPAAPNRAQALQAAIAALQSAVVALQAVNSAEQDPGEPGPVKTVDVPAAGTSK